MIRRSRIVVPMLASVALAAPAGHASAADRMTHARSLAATCANCHGTDGHARKGSAVLAGRPRDEIVERVMAYRDGRKPATVMGQIARGYTPEQIALIAEYFSTRQP